MSLKRITKRQEYLKEIQEKFDNLFFNSDDTLKSKFLNLFSKQKINIVKNNKTEIFITDFFNDLSIFYSAYSNEFYLCNEKDAINIKLIDDFLNIKEEVDQDIIKNVDYLKNKILLNSLLTDRLQNTKHTKKMKI